MAHRARKHGPFFPKSEEQPLGIHKFDNWQMLSNSVQFFGFYGMSELILSMATLFNSGNLESGKKKVSLFDHSMFSSSYTIRFKPQASYVQHPSHFPEKNCCAIH